MYTSSKNGFRRYLIFGHLKMLFLCEFKKFSMTFTFYTFRVKHIHCRHTILQVQDALLHIVFIVMNDANLA